MNELVTEWLDISTAPTDDRKFLIGKWIGALIQDEDGILRWHSEATWEQCISHHENPSGPHPSRGWNHRNGPMSDPTHWRDLPAPPER